MVPGMGNATRPFYLTPEAPAYAALASFYGTPVVSMRNALWRSGKPNSAGLINLNAVSSRDGSTPLDSGHKSIADTLVFLTQRTAEDLVLLPYGDYDRNSMSRDLPDRGVYSGECNSGVWRQHCWLAGRAAVLCVTRVLYHRGGGNNKSSQAVCCRTVLH